MANTNIQLLRSSIEQKRPTASVLLDGQVALNINNKEPGLFFRLTNGQLAKVGPVAVTTDGIAPNASAVGSPGNSVGELWYDDRISFCDGVTKMWDGTDWSPVSGFQVDNATGDFSLCRDLTVNRLLASTVVLTDDIVMSSNILSDGDCLYNIGHDLNRFNVGYFCSLNAEGSVFAGQDFVGDAAILSTQVITKDLNVSGNTTLGLSSAEDLIVNAGSTFEALLYAKLGVNIKGDSVIGDPGLSCANTLAVHSTTTFNCPVTFKDEVTFEKGLLGDTIIGNGCNTSTLTIDATTTVKCDVLPGTTDAINLGSPTQRFANIYTGDLHLKNERGDWTMIEEDEYLTLRNNKSGKTFRLVMEEV